MACETVIVTDDKEESIKIFLIVKVRGKIIEIKILLIRTNLLGSPLSAHSFDNP
jgi:hypothetical protein